MEALYGSLFGNKSPKIIAAVKNFAAHNIEMNSPDMPPRPTFFLKPLTSIIQEGEDIVLPEGGGKVHHEVELGVVLCAGGKNVSEADAESLIGGYCLALDMTERNLENEAHGYPWLRAKGPDTFCPLSRFIPKEAVRDPYQLELELRVNGEVRQKGSTADMYYKIDRQLNEVSKNVTLCPGDVLLTGTPAGVGYVNSGDRIECFLRQGEEVIMTSTFSVR